MEPTPVQLRAFLQRVSVAADEGRVCVTTYVVERAADELQWDQWDIIEQLKELDIVDHRHCETSRAPTADLIWVFTPTLWDGDQVWIRLIERDGIVVVGFHKA